MPSQYCHNVANRELCIIADFPQVDESYDNSNRRSKHDSAKTFCANLFPCACREDKQDNYECKETSSKLLPDIAMNEKDNGHMSSPGESPGPRDPPKDGGSLTPEEAGAIYRDAPTPSAPVLDGNDLYPEIEVKGHHFYDRSDSLPVQASS